MRTSEKNSATIAVGNTQSLPTTQVSLAATKSVKNCRAHFALAGSQDKELKLLGVGQGQQVDYGHGDLVLGTRAHLEMYPALIAWLSQRATPVDLP